MNRTVLVLWLLVQLAIGFHLFFPFILVLLHKLIYRKATLQAPQKTEADYAIIVTAYEQLTGVKSAVNSLLQLRYSNYVIYIVADKCDVSNLHFDDPRVQILRPPTALNSNTRSHFYAIHHFVRPHMRLTIIDSDNLTDPEYLNELNTCFDRGFNAVQGVRLPKNLDTTIACVDAARDIYYHYYDGKLLFEAGSSATLSGSGMAFTTSLYRTCLAHRDVEGAGFDKVLQAAIINAGERIAFAEKAIVYDEKTTKPDQLVNQRARWINTWFRYFSFGFKIVGKGIAGFRWNQILFGMVLLRPPLFIFLLLSIVLMVINVFIFPMLAFVWMTGFVLFTFSFLLALRHAHTDPRIYRSLINIPKFIFYQIISLVHSGSANKRSVATRHYVEAGIDDIVPTPTSNENKSSNKS